jgi:hypothetical protein
LKLKKLLLLYLGNEVAQQVLTTNGNPPPLLQQSNIEIDGRLFPAGIVISWSDIKMEREIGQGNFGKVYQGYVDMHEVQR